MRRLACATASACVIVIACGGGGTTPVSLPRTPSPATTPGPVAPASPIANDVVIGRSQFGQTVSVKKGQTLSIAPPADFSAWQVDYASEVLRPLTPPARMRSPGRDGWRFEAIAPGETDVALTAVMTVDPGSPAPPPSPPRFSVTIRVQ